MYLLKFLFKSVLFHTVASGCNASHNVYTRFCFVVESVIRDFLSFVYICYLGMLLWHWGNCTNASEISVKGRGEKTQNHTKMAKHEHDCRDVSQNEHCSYDGRGYPVLEPFYDDSSGSTKFGSPKFVALNCCRTWFTKTFEMIWRICSDYLIKSVIWLRKKKSCKYSQVVKNSFKTNDSRLCLCFLLNVFWDRTFAIIY